MRNDATRRRPRRGRWLLPCCAALLAAWPPSLTARADGPATSLPAAGEAAPEVLAARGILAFQRGRFAAAVALLRPVAARADAPTPVQHYLGAALLRLGRTTEGRRVLAAAAREAADPPLLTDLAQAYAAEANHAWALRTLRRAADAAPADGRIRYLLGRTLLRLRRADEGQVELERAERSGGAEAQPLALQLALAHYIQRRWQDSREQLAGHLTGADGAAARRLLRATYEGEGTSAALLSAEISLGTAVDSNPLYEHESTSPTALALTLDGRLTLRPWVDTRNLLAGELRVARAFLFPVDSAAAQEAQTAPEDVSRTELRAAASFARRRLFNSRSWGARAAYDFGLVFFDATPAALARAGEPTLVDANHIFVEAHGVHLSLEQLRHDLELRYSLRRQAFADLPRSNWSNALTFELGHLLLGGKLRLLGWAQLRHEAADSPDYDALAPGAGAGLSALLPGGVVFGLRGGYEHKNHYHSGNARRWGQTLRLDHTVDLTVEAGRALWRGLRIAAVYQRLQKVSSVGSFDYGKDLASLTLSWSTR